MVFRRTVFAPCVSAEASKCGGQSGTVTTRQNQKSSDYIHTEISEERAIQLSRELLRQIR